MADRDPGGPIRNGRGRRSMCSSSHSSSQLLLGKLRQRIRLLPSGPHMALLPSAIGPEPIVRLEAGSLTCIGSRS
jgi:hypothetical protein